MAFFAGIDWAGREHAICVVDEAGKVVASFNAAHTADGIRALTTRLGRMVAPAELPIAIERPAGLLVDLLVEAGFTVVPIHPNVLEATRPRYSAARGKSDPGDAYILADVLRTDGHRFQALKPHGDETRALRALVRTRDDLVKQRVALANRLRSLLESFWAGAALIFADVDSPIALNFLRRFPTPASAAKLDEKKLAAFLAKHAYCGRRKPADLLARLREAPVCQVGELEAEAKGEAVLALVAVLEPLVNQLQRITAAVEHALRTHPDGDIIASFPRAGQVNAAQILAELGDERRRYETAERFAAEAGVAPVTRASGRHRSVGARFACNKRLRQALTCFADNSRHSSAWAADLYARARKRGCDHPHAIRILARAWARIIWRCWTDRVKYLEANHRAALKIQIA
jgi:transposase